jgi:integrase
MYAPVFSREIVSGLANYSKETYRVMFILFAVTGVRASELLALEINKHISEDFRTLTIAQQIEKPGRTKTTPKLKTPASYREVDLSTAVSQLLRKFVGLRKSGFLFATRTGRPIAATSALTHQLHPALSALGFKDRTSSRTLAGFHAFRRYRNTWLRNYTACPEGLRKYWLGHAGKEMGDRYDKIRTDRSFRLAMADTCGIGFDFAVNVPNVPNEGSPSPKSVSANVIESQEISHSLSQASAG